ncbi:hypothetical protein I3271_07410 [Photobacterium leiognathi]|uniref:hypothetical protein n=1 Tax=Photobacterium leiognathi TaxID=553611 RepID=UPI001EDF2367|nr:hypothetical protein [Photobacterium leiognathi]MCG3884513.1 hypothetical protein [Photobacterium leiognathi]
MQFTIERTGVELTKQEISDIRSAINETFVIVWAKFGGKYLSIYDQTGTIPVKTIKNMMTNDGYMAFNGARVEGRCYMPFSISVNNKNPREYKLIRTNNCHYSYFVLVVCLILKSLSSSVWKIKIKTEQRKYDYVVNWFKKQKGAFGYEDLFSAPGFSKGLSLELN